MEPEDREQEKSEIQLELDLLASSQLSDAGYFRGSNDPTCMRRGLAIHPSSFEGRHKDESE